MHHDVGRLFDILSYKRDYGSDSEWEFLNRFIAPLDNVKFDIEGNFWVTVGDNPTTLFSSHTDTVHVEDGRQKIFLIDGPNVLMKEQDESTPEYDDDCLGADDGVGVWIMLNMIEAGVPGLYIFHRGEECGGIGSHHIADNNPSLLKGINRAIAFDRRGVGDIITSQMGRVCCSDEFAVALGERLFMANRNLKMAPASGVYTDTANYIDLIPECTNISVGYLDEHTVYETLDVDFASELLEACIAVDWETLPTVRSIGWPNQVSSDRKHGYSDGYSSYNLGDGNRQLTYDELYDLCRDYPEIAAEILVHLETTKWDREEAQRSMGYNTWQY